MEANIDTTDAILAPLFTLGAISSVGIGDIMLFDTALSDAAITMGGTQLSYGVILSLIVLAIAAITNSFVDTMRTNRGISNNLDILDLKRAEQIGIVGTATILSASALVPGFRDFLISSDIAGLAALSVQALGYYTVSYAQ